MNVKLTKFNRLFFKTLAGCKDVLIKDKGFYYTIICDGEKAGVVGFVPALRLRPIINTLVIFREKSISNALL